MVESKQAVYDRLVRHAREASLLTSVESLLELGRADEDARRRRRISRRADDAPGRHDPRAADRSASRRLARPNCHDSPLAADPHSDTGTTIRELKRQYDKRVKLPQSLVEELTRTSVLGQQAWVPARANNDFASFRPLLEKTFRLKREQAEALGYPERPYDALLDDFEPGALTVEVARVLAGLARAAGAAGGRDRRQRTPAGHRSLARGISARRSGAIRPGGGRADRLRLRARPARRDGPSVLHRPRPARLPDHDALRRATFSRRVLRHPARSGARHLRPGLAARPVRPAAGRGDFAWASTNRNRGCGRTWSGAAGRSGTTSIRRHRPRFPRPSATCRSTIFTSPSTTCGRR